MKNSKQLKESLGVSFYASVPKIMIICYTVPEISHVLNVILFFTQGNFQPFSPTNSPKIKNFKKMKRHLEVSSFNTSVPKILIICYIAPKIWHMPDVIIFYFGLFLPLCPPNNLKNENFKKMKGKKHLEISFYTSVPKIMIIAILFRRYGT